MMKLPNDETQQNHLNGDGYSSDEFDPVEMMPPPVRDNDFSDYLWMENEEEFNSQVLRQLEEEELMEECIAAMIDDSANEESTDSHNADNSFANNSRTASDNFNSSMNSLSENVNILSLSSNGVRNNSSDNVNTSNSQSSPESASRYTAQSRLSRVRDVPPESRPTTNLSAVENGSKSTLNPDAKEFVPTPRSAVASPENEKVSS